MSEKKTVGGIPVECLTGESAAIWSGWRTLGDRELVREASAKGTHIKLAHKCLAFRRHCSVEQACIYFNKEVEIWITELLNKKQVYRASHILKNIGKDPVKYIFGVCIKSTEPLLRNYLCEYMINVKGFETEHFAAWNIVKSIAQHEEKSEIQDGLSHSICIDNVMKLPLEIKQVLCTELYFSLNNPKILKDVPNSILWDYLLSNNKIKALRLWIDARYNPDAVRDSDEIDQHLKSLFANLNITSDMVEQIDSSNASNLVKDLTKDYLCRYGIFMNEEENDLKLILNRVFGCGITLEEFSTNILSLDSCNIDRTGFLQTVNQQLCLTHCSQECPTQEDNVKLLKLFNALTDMCNTQDRHEDALTDGIVESINYLSDDFNEYLKSNYLLTITLILLKISQMRSEVRNDDDSVHNHEELIRDVFTNNRILKIGEYELSQEVVQSTLANIPTLQSVIEREIIDDITVYDLLDGFQNVNAKLLFKWRFKNEPLPTFTREDLVKKYGHKETLTYGYYLKEGRPHMAAHSLFHAQAKLFGNVFSQRKTKAALYAHVLALRNLDKSDVVCSCIVFIEQLRIDSSILRLHVTVAKYVQDHLDVSIENLLENVLYKNQTDLKSVISYLEQCFQDHLQDETLMRNDEQFVETLKLWDIIVRFARVHNCALPDTFPRYLTGRDLWFEFVAVSHIFAYPTKQVLENVKMFNDASIREHLLTCLNNNKLCKSSCETEEKPKTREMKRSLQNKDGAKQSESLASSSSKSGDDIIDTEHVSDSCISTTSDNDFWLIILNCHQSQDPPGALINASRSYLRPIFTILATCYEPSSVAAYCYCWMVISTAREDILLDYTECLEQQIWPSEKASELLNKMVECGYVKTVNRAYKIFMPDSILNPFFEFLTQAVNHGEFKESQRYLTEFKSQCSSLKSNRIMDWDSVHFTYLKNLYWVAVVATRCIVTALGYSFQSTSLRVKFLEALIKCNFSADLPVAVPDFQRLLDITRFLQKTDVALNFKAVIVTDNIYNFDTEIQRCINDLIAVENYSTALEIASRAELNLFKIILARYRNSFKKSVNGDSQTNSVFWVQCAQDFSKYNVPPQLAVEFFVEHAEKVLSHKERYEALKLAYETLKNTEIEQQTIDTLETAMWKSCILAGPENVEFDRNDNIFSKLKTELLFGLDRLQVSCSLTDKTEIHSAGILIDKLTDLGRVDVALRINTIFNYNHKDLQILMLCLSIAEGETSPADLTVQQKSLLEETSKNKQQKYGTLRNRGLQRLSSSLSLNTILSNPEPDKTSDTNITGARQLQMECISILEKLSETLNHGNEICSRVISCYKLAARLGKTYHSLLMLNNPLKFLQEVVESNIENKFETANDIIISYKIGTESVATFLTENIITHINRAIEDEQEDLIFMWGYSMNSHFHLIMELCNDTSLLGSKLLKAAQSLLGRYISTHDEKRNISALKTIVEILIRSHDCFTTSCNMEGIASVLRKCQNLANMLQMLKHWALLVRLVTGVGRFTEMNYIFQILKENDQFESLLGQGLDKVPGLKMALLDFLKRNCPEDKELFTLVALHFRLYYEIALMWENEAKGIIAKLISDILKECRKGGIGIPVEIRFTRDENIHKELQLAVTNFTHATQYYLQDKKLNLASRCSYQAQLVTLQIGLLNAVLQNQQAVCVLNLKSEEIDRVLSHILNFPQALIVTRAYNYHADWANLIYHHYILKGETNYLREFMIVNSLTPVIVQDCARRYRLEKSINHSMTNNMRTLVSELSDVECKYVLASQLGFKDIVEEMLNDPIVGSYLKDTIWKKGYTGP